VRDGVDFRQCRSFSQQPVLVLMDFPPPHRSLSQMAETNARLYLITPPIADAAAFLPVFESALSTCDIACVLLRMAPLDAVDSKAIARMLIPLAQANDVACLLADEPQLAVRAGADGVHIEARPERLADALGSLHPGRIVGAGGLTTRDAAMIAGESGVDYLMFGGPESEDSHAAIVERVAWWAEIFNVPCIGYARELGAIGDLVRAGADFVALGDAVFADPRSVVAALREAAFALAQACEPA
jgi:thiamine-phosphate pyrophosphorylase